MAEKFKAGVASAVLVGIAILLAGCGSMAFTVASFVVSGVSYVTTQKGVGDHVLSAALSQDCATWRLLLDEPICRDPRNELPENVAQAQFAALDVIPEAGPAQSSDLLEEPPPSLAGGQEFRLAAGGNPVIAAVEKLAARRVSLVGFPSGTELYALIQDDGALEVFAHRPGGANAGANLLLVLRIERYLANPSAFEGLVLDGIYHRVRDIAV
jgi:hypothetical protein